MYCSCTVYLDMKKTIIIQSKHSHNDIFGNWQSVFCVCVCVWVRKGGSSFFNFIQQLVAIQTNIHVLQNRKPSIRKELFLLSSSLLCDFLESNCNTCNQNLHSEFITNYMKYKSFFHVYILPRTMSCNPSIKCLELQYGLDR